MRVIPPLEITPARLTSTNAVELYANYNTIATYQAGDRVLDPSNSDVYESLMADNKNFALDNSPAWDVLEVTALPQASDMFIRESGGGITWTNINMVAGQVFATNGPIFNAVTYINLPALPHVDARYIVQYVTPPIYASTNTAATIAVLGTSYKKYDIAAVYSVGERVHFPNGKICISKINLNTGRGAGIQPPAWLKVGVSNKQAMFTYGSNQRTVGTSPLAVAVTPNKRVDSIDLSGLVNVEKVRIQVVSGGQLVYDQTINTVKRSVLNYYNWFFKPFGYKKTVAKFDLPPVANGLINIILTSASGNVEVGACIIGSQFYVGKTQYNAVRDYTNYSTVTREFDGSVANLVQRAGIPKTSQTVWVDKENAQAVSDMLMTLDATVAAWSGIDDTTDEYFEPVHIVGIVKSAPIDLSQPTVAILDLSLEAISPN